MDPRTPSPQEQGQSAETLAAEWMVARGYRLLARNWRSPSRQGEVDLVLEKGEALVFAEVRFRRSVAFGTPVETVIRSKRRKIILAALEFVAEHGLTRRAIRFDVLSVVQSRGGPRVEHYESAFDCELPGGELPVF